MTRTQLFQILRPTIERVTGLTGAVILADPNAPAPTGPYAAVEPFQRINERGQANIYQRNSTLTARSVDVEVRPQLLVDVSVNFYRGDAMCNASRLKQCNKRPDVSADLFAAKVGWFGTDAVNDLSTLVSGNVERRAQITLRVGFEQTDEVTVNNIESVGVEVQYEDGTVVATVEVPPQ